MRMDCGADGAVGTRLAPTPSVHSFAMVLGLHLEIIRSNLWERLDRDLVRDVCMRKPLTEHAHDNIL